eukprot:COSAG02_NODE_15774_length_1142_cov_0.942474_2_plen_43_part_01
MHVPYWGKGATRLVGTEDLRQAKQHVQVLLVRERRAAATAELE